MAESPAEIAQKCIDEIQGGSVSKYYAMSRTKDNIILGKLKDKDFEKVFDKMIESIEKAWETKYYAAEIIGCIGSCNKLSSKQVKIFVDMATRSIQEDWETRDILTYSCAKVGCGPDLSKDKDFELFRKKIRESIEGGWKSRQACLQSVELLIAHKHLGKNIYQN